MSDVRIPAPRRALCLEPSSAVRSLLEKILRLRGWVVHGAAELPDLEQCGPIDLVITAGTLPGMDYPDIVRAVRSRAELATIPVVLVTASLPDEVARKAIEHGITEVFLKTSWADLEAYLDVLGADDGYTRPVGGRALVLDDDVAVGAYMAEVLAGLGLAVDRAVSLDEALGLVLVGTYDLVVADIVLDRGQTGNQFVRLLRQSVGHALQTPVIVVSGFHDGARKLDALRAGANVYLPKPVPAAELTFFAQKLLLGDPGAGTGAATGSADPSFDLSRREQAICSLVVAGMPDKRIAEQLGISYWTVRSHMASIFRKCGVMNRVELANRMRSGLPKPVKGRPTKAPLVDWLALSAHVLDRFRYGVAIADRRQAFVYANPAFASNTGYPVEELLGETSALLRTGRQGRSFVRTVLRELRSRGSWSGEVWIRRKDGGLRLQWLEVQVLQGDTPVGGRYLALLSGVAENGLDLAPIRYTALHDPLTGLANRTLLHDRAQQEFARARRFGGRVGVLFIDLDRFKTINDQYGHEAGDQLLCLLAGRLRAGFRNNDTVARVGGDEFVALVPDLADGEALARLAAKVAAEVRAPLEFAGVPLTLGASIGIAIYPDHGLHLEDLVALADQAMYRAKAAGGSQVCFAP